MIATTLAKPSSEGNGMAPSSRAPWKRSACDRCRAQKLRCRRDEASPTEACLRCLKADVACVTSTARPTGRPSSSRQHLHADTSSSSQSQTNNSSPDGSSAGAAADVGSLLGMDYDVSSLDNFLDSIGMRHADLMATDDTLVIDPQVTSQGGELSPTTSSTMSMVPAQSQIDTQQPGPFQFNGLSGTDCVDPGLLGRTSDVQLLLSKLHSDLSAQLLAIRSAPWDVKGTLSLTSSHTGDGSQFEPSDAHPLVQVSKVSKELERLLAGLGPPRAADHSRMGFSYTAAFEPRLRTTQLLVALSCYIQIVSIYDIIFSKVCDYLVNSSKASSSSAAAMALQSSAPTLYLGGLPIPPNQTLSGSLLVHLTEHELHQIEQLMGLPEHYRVSSTAKGGSKDGEVGLFGGQHSQSVLNAVIQLGEDRDGNHDDIRCVRSLKRKMRQIKDF